MQIQAKKQKIVKNKKKNKRCLEFEKFELDIKTKINIRSCFIKVP